MHIRMLKHLVPMLLVKPMAAAVLLLLLVPQSHARPSREAVYASCIETLAEARKVPGWRNEHLKYHLKRDGSGTKCWFNPEDDEMPTAVAKATPKVVRVAAAAVAPIIDVRQPDPVQPPPETFESRWDVPGNIDFDSFFTAICGGPCPQITEAGYETYTDQDGRLRYREKSYLWAGETKRVTTSRITR
jgi:hypothetical protein